MTVLTDKQLKEIRRREQAANPGPWYCEVDGWPVRNVVNGNVPYYDDQKTPPGPDNPYSPYSVSFETLDFVAHSRQDIPDLLDTIVSLKRSNEIVYKEGFGHMKAHEEIRDLAKRLAVELQDLRQVSGETYESIGAILREAKEKGLL